ncbi:MAG: DUF1415 domain-containing protein, partial [Gammaproteobacteria bacterium]|nr:DUF1415 domain-containing protein [Gammaproteobacteria bacterium]
MNKQQIEATVRKWVGSFVVDLNICPFAKKELVKKRVRFAVTEAATEESLLMALESELELLNADPAIETTLLIHPRVLQDFGDYNQFLDLADGLLVQMELENIYQVASFHPDYQFAGTDPGDAENYTNRSPYPVLHLLREDSLDQVLSDSQDADQIPLRNIE